MRYGKRTITRVLAGIVALLTTAASFTGPAPSLASLPSVATAIAVNGGSGPSGARAIVPRLLIDAPLQIRLSEETSVDLRRATIDSEARGSIAAAGGVIALFVDSGALGVDVLGVAVVTSAPAPGMESTTVVVNSAVDLRYGDQLVLHQQAVARVINEAPIPTSLLVVSVTPTAEQPEVDRPGAAASIAWELLARGTFVDTPVWSRLVLTRVAYRAGAADKAATPNSGPLLLSVEHGTVRYVVEQGDCKVIAGAGQDASPVQPGREIELSGGAYAVEEWGTTSRLLNPTDERAWVLATTLVRTEPEAPATALPSAYVREHHATGRSGGLPVV